MNMSKHNKTGWRLWSTFLLLLVPGILLAQEKPAVTGIVQNRQGEILIGVSVSAENMETGKRYQQMTDEKGTFRLFRLPPGNKYRFTFSYIGYTPLQLDNNTIKTNETLSLLAKLETSADSLSQVVVVGYGTQKKGAITGAISQVGAEVFENRPLTNVAQGLQGTIPNLNITFSDGQPGRGADINVRGYTSINGGGPLILIDGTPGDINLINPEDVESVTVLKDAASAAIYGARAAFGVVLVTTRSGKSGKLRIRYSNNMGWSTPTRLPHVLTNALEAAKLQNAAAKGWNGADQAGLLTIIDYLEQRKEDPSLPELGVNAAGNFIKGANTDWYDAFYNKQQFFSKHYLSASGGSEKTGYFVSIGYLNQKGAFKVATDDYKRYSFRLKLDQELTPWLQLSNNTEFLQGDYDAPNKFVDGTYNIYRYLALNANPYEAIRTPNGNYTAAGSKVFGQLEDGGRTFTRDRQFKNTLALRSSLLKNTLHLNADYTILVTPRNYQIQNLKTYYENRPNNLVANAFPDYYQQSVTETMIQNINLYADYMHSFGKHNLKALVGLNQELNQYDYMYARRDGNIQPGQGSLNLTTGTPSLGDKKTEVATRGYFYRLNYDYNGKYLLELNGRYDGTSRYPDSSRFGFFPSVSAGWVISNERFFTVSPKVINHLKVRASYGSLGNQLMSGSNGAYPYIPTMSVSTGNVILDDAYQLRTSAPGLVPFSLTWEKASTFDVGIDVNALAGRLEMGFDWYDRQTTNMLTKGKTLPAVLGANEPNENAADLSTKGWEFSLGWKDKFSLGNKPFTYSVSAVLSDNRSHITRFDNPGRLLNDYYVGQEIGEIWGYKTEGFFQSDDEYLKHADQRKVSSIEYALDGHPMAGDVKFRDRDGNGEINFGGNTVDDPGDRQIIGNSSPRYAYGVNFNFAWNGIDLTVFFQGIGKRDIWPGATAIIFWGPYQAYYQPMYDHLPGNYWTPENPNAYFPRLRAYQALSSGRSLFQTQTRYLQNAAYTRLKNLALGYTIPQQWSKRVGISKARLFFNGQNLFEWTKLHKVFDPEGTGSDPDSGTNSGTGFVSPFNRTYTFGVDINF